jgi:hypothetical protein
MLGIEAGQFLVMPQGIRLQRSMMAFAAIRISHAENGTPHHSKFLISARA